MGKVLKLVAATALCILPLTVPALAGGSAIGFGIAGFGIGALVGSALAPRAVYVGPPYYDPYYDDPYYYAPPPPMNWDGRRAYHSPARTNPSHASDDPEAAPKHSSTVDTPAYTGSIKQGSEDKRTSQSKEARWSAKSYERGRCWSESRTTKEASRVLDSPFCPGAMPTCHQGALANHRPIVPVSETAQRPFGL
jgi:hypothetical protein